MRRRQALSIAGGALAAPAFIRSARAQDAPLRLATAPFDVSAEPYYADEMGFFKKNGIANVSVQTFTSGGAMTAAIVGGAIDIAVSNIVTLAVAHGKNVPVTIVAPAGVYSASAPTSVLMVAKNAPIQSAKDLSGKTIGVNSLSGIAQFAPEAWIDRNGGDASTVKFLELSEPEIIAGLAQGRVAAGLVIEPYIAAAKADSRVLADCFDAVAPAFLISAHFAMLPWARAHADLVRRYQNAIRETAAWANKNRARTGEILVKVAKLAPEDVRRMTRIVYAERTDPAQVQPTIDVTAKYGGIAPFAAKELIFEA